MFEGTQHTPHTFVLCSSGKTSKFFVFSFHFLPSFLPSFLRSFLPSFYAQLYILHAINCVVEGQFKPHGHPCMISLLHRSHQHWSIGENPGSTQDIHSAWTQLDSFHKFNLLQRCQKCCWLRAAFTKSIKTQWIMSSQYVKTCRSDWAKLEDLQQCSWQSTTCSQSFLENSTVDD